MPGTRRTWRGAIAKKGLIQQALPQVERLRSRAEFSALTDGVMPD
jgi:hypothetical protein